VATSAHHCPADGRSTLSSIMVKVLDLEEFERRGRCRRRYGRATVMIRRSGGWGEFLTSPGLHQAIAAFEREDGSAEAACWAFARARVESHSPTFDWRSADLSRLLRLVCECSSSPLFATTDPESVAQTLIGYRAETTAGMDAVSGQISDAVRRATQSMSGPGFQAVQAAFGEQTRQQVAHLSEMASRIVLPELQASVRRFTQVSSQIIAPSRIIVVPPAVAAATAPIRVIGDVEAMIARVEQVAEQPTPPNIASVLDELLARVERMEQKQDEGDEESRSEFLLSVYLALILFVLGLLFPAPRP
jgi:hypothetical protein